MKDYKEKLEKILDYYESDGSNITYKKTEADLFSLMLDFAEDVERRPEYTIPTTEDIEDAKLEGNQVRAMYMQGQKDAHDAFIQRIEEMRKKV